MLTTLCSNGLPLVLAVNTPIPDVVSTSTLRQNDVSSTLCARLPDRAFCGDIVTQRKKKTTPKNDKSLCVCVCVWLYVYGKELGYVGIGS